MEMLVETLETLPDGTLKVLVLRAIQPGQFSSDRVDLVGVRTEVEARRLAEEEFLRLDEKRAAGQ